MKTGSLQCDHSTFPKHRSNPELASRFAKKK